MLCERGFLQRFCLFGAVSAVAAEIGDNPIGSRFVDLHVPAMARREVGCLLPLPLQRRTPAILQDVAEDAAGGFGLEGFRYMSGQMINVPDHTAS